MPTHSLFKHHFNLNNLYFSTTKIIEDKKNEIQQLPAASEHQQGNDNDIQVAMKENSLVNVEAIIFADYCQFDDILQSGTPTLPTNQCAAMAATALAFHTIFDASLWTTENMNNIIFEGQIYYRQCWSKLPKSEQELGYLDPHCLPRQLTVNSTKFDVDPHCRHNPSDITKDNMRKAFQHIECSKYSTSILTYAVRSYGIIRLPNQHYVFYDSHGRNQEGVAVDPMDSTQHGKAALLFFTSLEQLIDFFINQYDTLYGQFQVTPIIITVVTTEMQNAAPAQLVSTSANSNIIEVLDTDDPDIVFGK